VKFLQRRLFHAAFLVVGVSILCFLFTDLAPGSFFDEMKLNPQVSPETVADLKAQYGLGKPLPVRYALWVKSVMKGEWGFSFAYDSPVRPLLVPRAENTLLLTGSATALAWLIAVPWGVWVAYRPGSWRDRIGMAVTSLLLSVPELALVLGLLCFAVRTHALPVGGMTSVNGEQFGMLARFRDLLAHLAIPLTALVVASLPVLVRHVRASMIEVLDAPFIHAVRGHGVAPSRVLFRYALPAAANPLISLFGFSLGGLLAGSLLVEAVTGWPGLGPLLLEATMSRDLYIVVGVVMVSTFFMVGGNLLADALLVAFDPRMRTD
jgi:peptide/nickel transport system permease protein